MLRFARKHHGRHGRFLQGDGATLRRAQLRPGTFDAAGLFC